jgi:hypothetical protein
MPDRHQRMTDLRLQVASPVRAHSYKLDLVQDLRISANNLIFQHLIGQYSLISLKLVLCMIPEFRLLTMQLEKMRN